MAQISHRFGLKSFFLAVTVLAGASAIFLHTPQSRRINRLRAAIQSGNAASVIAELDRISQSNPNVLSGKSALHYACQLDNVDVVRAIVECGADVDARDHFRQAPLHVAAAHGHSKVAKYLLESGADVVARDDANCTPAKAAAMMGHSQIAAMIRRHEGAVAAVSDIAAGNLRLKVGGYILESDHSRLCAKYLEKTFTIHIEYVGCDLSDMEFMEGYNAQVKLAVMRRFGRSIESIFDEAARQSAPR
jgi:ankyrin repeat protein